MHLRRSTNHQNCISEARLGDEVRAQLSASSGQDGISRRIDVLVSESSSGLVADLHVSGAGQGTRRIEATHCAGLVDALAFTIAMILDPNAHAGRGPESDTRSLEPEADEPRNPRQPRAATGRQLAESQGPPSGRPQQALLAAQQPATRTPMSPVEHEWRLWFGGGPGTWATWHLESGVGYRANRAALELGLFYQPRSDHAFGNGSVRIETFGGFAAGCVRSGTRWRALVCLRAQGGAERVQGVGFQTGRASTLPGFGVGPSGGFEAGSRWVVGLSLYLQMAVLRDEFKVDNMPDTLQAPPISAWLVARIALTSRSDSH